MSAPVYLVFGEDEYRVSGKTREIINSLVPPENASLALETIDASVSTVDEAISVIRRAIEAFSTMGFFGAGRVAWLKHPNFLSDTRVGKSADVKDELAKLADLIKTSSDTDNTLVISSASVDKRFAFFKACKSAGEVYEFAFSSKSWENEKHAKDTVRGIMSKFGLQLSFEAQELFLEKVGTDTRNIVNETTKLAIYVGNRKEVSREDVALLTCSSREAIGWDLTDAVGARNLQLALTTLRQLLFQGEYPGRIVGTLQSRIRELMVYREALDRGWLSVGQRNASWKDVPADVDRMLSEDFERDPRKTHPFRVGILAQQARKFSPEELESCLRATAKAYTQLNTSSTQPIHILETLLIRMLG